MSVRLRAAAASSRGARIRVFAALGDSTRLELVSMLSDGQPRSIARLTGKSRITRQAVTKHLRVLERAGVVESVRVGRENQFRFNVAPIDDLRHYLDHVSEQWEQALGRLKRFVEDSPNSG